MLRLNVIMLLDASGEKLLMCRRRKDPYMGLYNFSGGKAEAGEHGLHAAYRELREETGAVCEKLTYLGPLYTTPALIDEVIHMYMAEGLDTGDMLEKAEIVLDKKETGGSLFDRPSALGGELILSTLEKMEIGRAG